MTCEHTEYNPAIERFLLPDPLPQTTQAMTVSSYGYADERPTVYGIPPVGPRSVAMSHPITPTTSKAVVKVRVASMATFIITIKPLTAWTM